jgi:hypothetical protein
MTTFKLNTGASIPALGFGTWQDKENQESAVAEALKAGVRHIDTARGEASGSYVAFKYWQLITMTMQCMERSLWLVPPSKKAAFHDPNSSLLQSYGTLVTSPRMWNRLSTLL